MQRAFVGVVLLAGCGGGVRETQTPAGETVFEVSCEGDGAKCLSAAKKKCPDGVGVVEETEATSGPHSLTFRCQRNGDFFADSAKQAEQKSAGPSGAQIAGAILSGVAEAKPFGSESGGKQCRSGADCERESVCAQTANSNSSGFGVCVQRQRP